MFYIFIPNYYFMQSNLILNLFILVCYNYRKYVPADPQKDRSELSCNKLYVNV